LGVTRKLLKLWLFGKSKTYKFGSRDINDISEHLKRIKPFIPYEFNRSPRDLNEVPRWKATELRQFLLYTGVVVLKNKLPQQHFRHFTSLVCAVTILSNYKLINNYLSYAKDLLKYFVECYTKLYGKENLSYNVHGLLHVIDDVQEFGNINNYSAFPFENFLGQLKRLIRGGNLPLSQICGRISERNNVSLCQTKKKVGSISPHNNGPLTSELKSPQFYKFQFDNYSLQSDSKNCYCVLKDKTIIKILNFATHKDSNEIRIIGRECKPLQSLFESPCDSKIFGIYFFSKIGGVKNFEISEVTNKYCVFPCQKVGFAAFPLLHVD
jgi:hypothetical protein